MVAARCRTGAGAPAASPGTVPPGGRQTARFLLTGTHLRHGEVETAFPTMICTRRALLARLAASGGAVWLAGCARAMRSIDSKLPPLVLTPLKMAGIRDRRAAFRLLFSALARGAEAGEGAAERYLWRLPGEGEVGEDREAATADLAADPLGLHLVIVQGFGAQCFEPMIRALEDAIPRLARIGVRVSYAPVTAFGSVRQNAGLIARGVRELALAPGERLVLLGYSKGAADALEALVRFPDLAARTAALLSLAGAVNGSPLAELVPDWIEELVALLPGLRCDLGDRQGLEDLRPAARLRAMAGFPLPPPVPLYALVAFAPYEEISGPLQPFWRRLAQIDPRNDGQLLWYDQIPPHSTLLAYLRGDHLAVGMPITERLPALASAFDRNAFPRTLVIETALRLIAMDLAARDRRAAGR